MIVRRSSALRLATSSCSRLFVASNAAAMRAEPRSVSSTVTSRRSLDDRLRATKPFRSSVLSALEMLARDALASVAIARGSRGPSVSAKALSSCRTALVRSSGFLKSYTESGNRLTSSASPNRSRAGRARGDV